MASEHGQNHSTASVLVGLLWCLALLSVLVIGVLHRATVDLRVVKNYGDRVQAHYLALAGTEKAKALLFLDARARRGSGRNHSGELYDATREFKDIPLGRGQFSVLRQGSREEGGGLIYGISDEESRLNLNTASAEELGKLENMTPDIVAAIIDWRDSDNTPSPGGAEAEYYASLNPPYLPRNGPFETTRELLMVRGVSLQQFAGEDTNLNGLLDPEEDDGNDSYPPDNRDGILDAGWSGILTVNSRVRNVNAAGQNRVNIQSADESSLAAVRGVSAELARSIVAYRGQNKLESLADLLDVTAAPAQQPNAPAAAGPTGGPTATPGPRQNAPGQPPQGAPGNNPLQQAPGPKIVTEQMLMDMADDLTTVDGQEQQGAININTAAPTVLTCLAGVTPQLAQAIVSYRKSAGYFQNLAGLLQVPGMDRQVFKQIAPRVTARSETFRILSEGRIQASGARQRLEVIVHVGDSDVETVAYREDL